MTPLPEIEPRDRFAEHLVFGELVHCPMMLKSVDSRMASSTAMRSPIDSEAWSDRIGGCADKLAVNRVRRAESKSGRFR
jgi:hypothetical protein